MNQEERATQYDKIGRSYLEAQREFFESNIDTTRIFIHRTINWPFNESGLEDRTTLLDLGCGTGEDLRKYLENDFDAYGTDASQEMLKEALNNVCPSRLRLARHTNIPFNNEFFDVVTSRFSLHYLDSEELIETYKEVARVLKPKGTFIAVARHPIADLLAKPSKDYFEEEETTLKLYKGTIPVTTPSHTIQNYLLPLVRLFDLVEFEEGTDQADMIPNSKFKVPNYIAFKATKR